MEYHPRPADNEAILEAIPDKNGRKGDSLIRYSNYRNLIHHETHLRILEDIGSEALPEELILYGHKALLGLKKGEVVEVVERWHTNYWVVMCSSGECGLIRMDNRVTFVLTPKVRVLWSRVKGRGIEMNLLAGTELELLYPHDGIWVWAMWGTGKDIGLIPLSFIECIPPVLTEEDPSVHLPTPERPYDNQEWDPLEIIDTERDKCRALWPYSATESRFLTLSRGDIVEILCKPYEDWWIGVIFSTTAENTRMVERLGMFPQNHVHSSLTRTPSPILGRTLTGPPWSPYYVRAIFSRKPQHGYELGIVKGDIIEVEIVSPDMWWKGRNRSGEAGWLPQNYVTPVFSRFHPIRQDLA